MNDFFRAGINIAVKIPKHLYEPTVSFYRDVLKLETREQPIQHPTVSRTHRVQFGTIVLWLDCVDNYTHSETWLQLTVPDIAAAREYFKSRQINTCDHIESIPENMHWIMDPAGTVFNVQERDKLQ